MSVVIMIDSTYVVSPDFDPTVVPEGYIWDETAFQELVKATDKATAAETIYTYGGPQGGAEVDYLNAADLTISNVKYDGGGEVVGTTVTANAFTNTGTAPLIIHQAFASCGCTVPTYTKEPIKPGEKGVIDVTYNGTDKFPGHFQKTITIRSNAISEVTRLIIEGDME